MNLYDTIYLITTLLSAGILLMLSLYSWNRRATVPGARPFFWMVFVTAGWMLFWFLELVVQDIAIKMLMNSIRYSFVLFVAYTINVFIFHFCGWFTWITPQRLLLFAFIPIIGLLLIWSNPFHHLVWQDYHVVQQDWLHTPQRLYGPWFTIQNSYHQLLRLLGFFIIIHTMVTQPAYRFQLTLFLIGMFALIVVDVLWAFRLVQGLSLYPFGVIVLTILFAWALFRYRFLDLVPVVHHVMFQTMHDSVIVLDKYHRIVAINPSALRLTGLSEAQVIGMPIQEVVPPDFSRTIVANHRDHAMHSDVSWQQAEGPRVYDAQLSPLTNRRGICTGQILVLRDNTERKQMMQALQASEERFRMLAEHSQHVIFRLQIHPTRRYDYMSPAFTTMTGYTPDEAYADPDIHFKIAHPESRATLLALSEQRDHLNTTITLRYIHKDGSELWVEQDVWTIYDADGRPVAIEGVVRDRTQHKQAEQQLMEQQKSLTMLRERERLARELHDNLGQVLGYLAIHAQGVRDMLVANNTPQAMTMTEQIIHISQSAFTDVREYILGVQIHASTLQLQSSQTHQEQSTLYASLDTYLREFSGLSGINATLDGAADIVPQTFAPTVETHLLRIVQEALSNVRKHAQATQVRVSFAQIETPSSETASCSSSSSHTLSITIQDNGTGFEPPDTTHTHPHFGHGYGLESMRSRAAECGGTLTIVSSPSTGTCIRVCVPFPFPNRTTNVADAAIRVLLADDNALFVQGLVSLLTRRGFQVVGTASNGNEAIEQALRLLPDIIVMDIHMPHVGGLQATRTITEKLPASRIVMLTVSEDNEHLFDAIKSGASGYLLKSMDGDDLCTMLHGLMQGEVPLSPGIATKILREFARHDRQTAQTQPAPHTGDSANEAPRNTVDNQNPAPVQAQSDNMPENDVSVLRDYEVELLTLVANGFTYAEISAIMHFSERTLKRYMSAILDKLHLQSRAEAITYARRQGLIQDRSPT